MPTMKDVAREAGVSLGTVSNVLNRPEVVFPEKRERVLQAIRRLGYQSNLVARTLKTRTSHSIGLILPDIKNPYYPGVARGVEDAAQRAGLTVFLCNNDRNLQKERAYIDALLQKSADGIILVKPQITREEIYALSARCKIVLVDGDLEIDPDMGISMINVDDKADIRRALELLYRYGHRRIAFISGLLESYGSRLTYNIYRQFLQDYGLSETPGYLFKGNYGWEDGYRAGKRMMELPTPPTAIFAANDLMAIGAVKAIRESGRQIPEEVSVFGYDDIDMAQLCEPALTTVHLPKYELGAASVELLEQVLRTPEEEGKTVPHRRVTLSTKIVLRGSVGPARGELAL